MGFADVVALAAECEIRHATFIASARSRLARSSRGTRRKREVQ